MPFDPTTKTSTTSTTPNPMLQNLQHRIEEYGCEIAFEDQDQYLACQNHLKVLKNVIQKGGGPKMQSTP